MRALWLPEVLRAAGLVVDTYPGWETRGSESWGPIAGVIDHATAGSSTSTDMGEMRVLWETGSTSAPAPIAQCYLSRSGLWVVGASGRCNHVKLSAVLPWPPIGNVGNSHLIGVEAQNDNRGQHWPDVQVDAYTRGVAAILRHLKLSASKTCGHWEHQDGKTDPYGLSMGWFRNRVAELLDHPETLGAQEMFFMYGGGYWYSNGTARRRIPNGTVYGQMAGSAPKYPGADANGFPTPDLATKGWSAEAIDIRFGPDTAGAAGDEVPDHAHDLGATGGVIRGGG
jgi:hypothetical protein